MMTALGFSDGILGEFQNLHHNIQDDASRISSSDSHDAIKVLDAVGSGIRNTVDLGAGLAGQVGGTFGSLFGR